MCSEYDFVVNGWVKWLKTSMYSIILNECVMWVTCSAGLSFNAKARDRFVGKFCTYETTDVGVPTEICLVTTAS